MEPLEWNLIKKYYGVIFFFVAVIFTNIKALQFSNVETVIVFRTLTTLAIAYGDFRFLKTSAPSPKVLVTLFGIVTGAIVYVLTDSTFHIESYMWVVLYFLSMCSETLYTKHITNSVPMSSWGRSFYNNTLAMIPMLIFMFLTGETEVIFSLILGNKEMSRTAIFMVVLSSFMGLFLSLSSFVCREVISATSFSVVGNMNKVITVFINCLIWDKHASPYGLLSLGVCLVSGGMYGHLQASKK